jgi:hypothetical protein
MNIPGPFTFMNRPSRNTIALSYSLRTLIELRMISTTTMMSIVGKVIGPPLHYSMYIHNEVKTGVVWIEFWDALQCPRAINEIDKDGFLGKLYCAVTGIVIFLLT